MAIASSPPARTAVVLGLDTQAGAYLARLLLARGYRVAGTAARPATGLAKLGVAGEVAQYPDAASALALPPAEVYDLRGYAPTRTADTAALLALLAGQPIRLFSAGPGAKPDEATALIETARSRGAFAVTGRMFAHESRLNEDASPLTRIVAAVAAGVVPDPDDIATTTDCGWTAEYVDPIWRMLQQALPADVVIATGRLLTGNNVARFAAEYFGCDLPALPDSDIGGEVGDPTAARTTLGWSATTWGRDLVRILCEGVVEQ